MLHMSITTMSMPCRQAGPACASQCAASSPVRPSTYPSRLFAVDIVDEPGVSPVGQLHIRPGVRVVGNRGRPRRVSSITRTRTRARGRSSTTGSAPRRTSAGRVTNPLMHPHSPDTPPNPGSCRPSTSTTRIPLHAQQCRGSILLHSARSLLPIMSLPRSMILKTTGTFLLPAPRHAEAPTTGATACLPPTAPDDAA